MAAECKPGRVAEYSSVTGEIQGSTAENAHVCWAHGPVGVAETLSVQGGVSATQSAIRGGFGNESGGFGNPSGVSVRGLDRGARIAAPVLDDLAALDAHDVDDVDSERATGGRMTMNEPAWRPVATLRDHTTSSATTTSSIVSRKSAKAACRRLAKLFAESSGWPITAQSTPVVGSTRCRRSLSAPTRWSSSSCRRSRGAAAGDRASAGGARPQARPLQRSRRPRRARAASGRADVGLTGAERPAPRGRADGTLST